MGYFADRPERPFVLPIRYYKQHGYKTIVMGAGFRNIGEIEQLAGCDRTTISPNLMAELEQDSAPLIRRLDPAERTKPMTYRTFGEAEFRWDMNENAMATEKLAQGIRAFTVGQIKLEQLLAN